MSAAVVHLGAVSFRSINSTFLVGWLVLVLLTPPPMNMTLPLSYITEGAYSRQAAARCVDIIFQVPGPPAPSAPVRTCNCACGPVTKTWPIGPTCILG